jgi:hypothetical protein
MRLTNINNLPDSIVRAVANDGYDSGGADITVTQLVAPPQQVELVRQHWDEIEEDVSDRIWLLMGRIAHGILERADHADALTEERLATEVDGWRVTGQFDRMIYWHHNSTYEIQDYKITSAWSAKGGEVKPEWIAQLNLYACLLRRHGFAVDKLTIVAILRDWRRNEAAKSADYPPRQVAVLAVPLWSPEEAERYLAERVRLHRRARHGKPEPCSDDERWKRNEAWAVMREGRKTALRVLSDERAAWDWLGAYVLDNPQHRKTTSIQFRPGVAVRCADYCSASPWCRQWLAEVAQRPDAP